MNFIVVTGFVSSEPKTTIVKTGQKVSEFCVAVKDDRKKADGTYATYYFRVNAWGGLADFTEKWIKKDSFVNVHGKLIQDRFKDKITGKTQFTFHINAEHIENTGTYKSYNKKESSGNGLLDYVNGEDTGNPNSMFT